MSAYDYITKLTQENSATADPENEEWPSLAQVEGRYIARVLGKTGGNKQAASRVLGVDRKTLNPMIDRHKITLGATPVFIDIDPISYTVTASAIEKAITPRTRAIIPVHLPSARISVTVKLARNCPPANIASDKCPTLADHRARKLNFPRYVIVFGDDCRRNASCSREA